MLVTIYHNRSISGGSETLTQLLEDHAVWEAQDRQIHHKQPLKAWEPVYMSVDEWVRALLAG